MKIELTKEIKLELLKAIKDGYLDTSKIPELVQKFSNIQPFLDLMKEASIVKYTKEDIDEIQSDNDEIYLQSMDKGNQSY